MLLENNIFQLAVIFICCVIAEIVYLPIAKRYGITSKPVYRSSHSTPIVEGGGSIFYIAVLLYNIINKGAVSMPFMAGLSIAVIVSFVDDVKSLSQTTRIIAHSIAMLCMVFSLQLAEIMPWWGVVITFFVSIGVINAYNFMDGINGITGLYSLVLLLSLAYINVIIPFASQMLIYSIILSVVAFLIFNFRNRALCFAGDVGSVGIAFIIVYLITKVILCTDDYSFIILLAVYGVDSILTIIRRLFLKENIFESHRRHLYQMLANEAGLNQLIVSAIYAVVQMLIIIGYLVTPIAYTWYYVAAVLLILINTYVMCVYLINRRSFTSIP